MTSIKLTKEELETIRNIRIHRILGVIDNGRKIRCPCPIHNGTNDNFVLNKDNSFHCFKCNASGRGAIDFTMKMGYDFNEALEQLAGYL